MERVSEESVACALGQGREHEDHALPQCREAHRPQCRMYRVQD